MYTITEIDLSYLQKFHDLTSIHQKEGALPTSVNGRRP